MMWSERLKRHNDCFNLLCINVNNIVSLDISFENHQTFK